MIIKILSLSATIYLIQIMAYFMERKLGEKRGAFLSAFFQGMLSSTALTLSNAKKSQSHHSHFSYHVLLMSSFAGIFASLVQLFIIIYINSSIFAQKLSILFPIYFLLIALMIYHRYHLKNFKSQEKPIVDFPKPLDAIKLAVILGGFIFITSLLQQEFGEMGPRVVAFLGGLFETHGVALAQVTLFDEKLLNLKDAYDNILLAVMAGFISKAGLTLFIVRNKYSYTLTLTYIILSLVTSVLWFYPI